MANYYKQYLTLSGDALQLPRLQDMLQEKLPDFLEDHVVEPESLEFNRPENLEISFVTRRLKEELASYVGSLIGPGNEFPDVWMDVEVTDLEEMNACMDFANEDLKQVEHYISSGGAWIKYRNTQEKREALTEAKTLLKAAEYAACHNKWNLHREQLELARDVLHDHWPNLFSKHQPNQTLNMEGPSNGI